jgi:hypothetical protein
VRPNTIQKQSDILANLQKHGFEIAGDGFPYSSARGYGKAKINNHLGKDILLLLVKKSI